MVPFHTNISLQFTETIDYFRVSRPIHKITQIKSLHLRRHLQSHHHTSRPKPATDPGSYSPTIISPHPSQSSPHQLCNCIQVHLQLRLTSACSCTTIKYRPLAYNRQLCPICASTTSTVCHTFDILSDCNRRLLPYLHSRKIPKRSSCVFPPKTSPPRQSPGHP